MVVYKVPWNHSALCYMGVSIAMGALALWNSFYKINSQKTLSTLALVWGPTVYILYVHASMGYDSFHLMKNLHHISIFVLSVVEFGRWTRWWWK